MNKRILFLMAIFVFFSAFSFAQTSSIRDFVGVINQSYHPSIIDFFEKMKEEMEDDGKNDSVKAVDRYLRGPFGTGFVYVDENGNNYVITNNHVINQAHGLKFTLEKNDGSKVIYEGLTVFAVDEDLDIAILIFANGAKPFAASMPFFTEELDEGENVFSAGFPGLGMTPIYQFGSGIVSNKRAMLPVDADGEEMIGPFIQHTAPIDPGNSGGPLLMRTSETETNYVIVGINTLKAMQRESANYAIPANRAMEFITRATGSNQGDQKAKLEERVNAFIKEVREPRAVYEKVAEYLSNACIADNAEYALMELAERGNRTAWYTIMDEFEHDPVSGLQLAVAWLIENSMRAGSISININLESIVPMGENAYTVTYIINNKPVSSTWALEYGIWRISTFGINVTGDKSLVAKKEEERAVQRRNQDAFLSFMLQGGVTILPDMDQSIGYNATFKLVLFRYATLGASFFGNGLDYNQLLTSIGGIVPVRLGSVTLMPFAEVGFGTTLGKSKSGPKKAEDDDWGYDAVAFDNEIDFGIGVGVQAGLVITADAVKGLYLYGNYQYNSMLMYNNNPNIDVKDYTLNNNIISIGIGYSF